MNPFWLVRMAKWARHPPPPRVIYMILGIVAVASALAIWEHYHGWPEALTVNPVGRRGVPVMQ